MIENKGLSSRCIERLQMYRWEFSPAVAHSDIIWENFTKDSVWSGTKTVFLWILLLIISVALVTPVLLTKYWYKLEEKMDLEYAWITRETMNEYVTSLTAMIVSIIIIPFLLDMMVLMEDWRT